MSNLGPQHQNTSFAGLLQVPGGITSTLQTVQDGNGNPTALSISTTAVSGLSVVAGSATNLVGGNAGELPYQSGSGTTSFVGAGTAFQLLQSNGSSAPSWTDAPRGRSFRFNGAVSGQITLAAPPTPANQIYNLPAAYPSTSGQVLSSTTAGTMSWVDQNATASNVFNILDYGASSSASAFVNTPAIQSAIDAAGNAGGGIVFFPAGIYQINGALLCNQSCVTLQGVSSGDADTTRGSKLLQVSTSDAIVHVTANYIAIDSLCLEYAFTPNSTCYGIFCEGHNCTFTNFTVVNPYIGLYVLLARTIFASKFIMTKCAFSAVTVEGGDIASTAPDKLAYGVFTDFIVSAPLTGGTGGLLRLYNKVEGSQFVNGQTLLGSLSFYMGATDHVAGYVPAYNQFTNCLFDSASGVAGAGNASFIAVTYETQMVGCWFSGGVYESTPASGLYINDAFALRFTGCSFFNSGQNGCTVAATCRHVSFDNCTFESNNRFPSATTGYGLVFATNASYFQVTNCFAGCENTFNPGQTQKYGIYVNAGCDNFIVANNDCTGNATGGIYNGAGISATKIVSNNLG